MSPRRGLLFRWQLGFREDAAADGQQKTALFIPFVHRVLKQFAPKEFAVLRHMKLRLEMQWDGRDVAARIKLRLQRLLLSISG